jgi:hypothetical protein
VRRSQKTKDHTLIYDRCRWGINPHQPPHISLTSWWFRRLILGGSAVCRWRPIAWLAQDRYCSRTRSIFGGADESCVSCTTALELGRLSYLNVLEGICEGVALNLGGYYDCLKCAAVKCHRIMQGRAGEQEF